MTPIQKTNRLKERKMKIKTLLEESGYAKAVKTISPYYDDDIIGLLKDLAVWAQKIESKQNEIIDRLNTL